MYCAGVGCAGQGSQEFILRETGRVYGEAKSQVGANKGTWHKPNSKAQPT